VGIKRVVGFLEVYYSFFLRTNNGATNMKIIQLASGERVYETPYGLFPSVTTILKKTMPEEQKQKPTNRRKRKSYKADLIIQEAAARGTLIHRLIEAKLKGEIVECPENLIKFWNKAQTTLKAIGKVSAVEEIVYHRELQYAGKFDLLADWRGYLTIFDFKTSHREKQAKWLSDAPLQVAAYKGALESLYHLKIEQGLIVVISPHKVQNLSLEKPELDKYWEQWLIRLQQYKALKVSPEVF